MAEKISEFTCLVRDMQSGSVQRYCIWFLGGALGLTILILLIC